MPAFLEISWPQQRRAIKRRLARDQQWGIVVQNAALGAACAIGRDTTNTDASVWSGANRQRAIILALTLRNALRARERYRQGRPVPSSLNRALQVLPVAQSLIEASQNRPLWWPTAKRDDIFRHEHGGSEVQCSLDEVLCTCACFGAGVSMPADDPTVNAVRYYLLAVERRLQDWLHRKAEDERAPVLW